MSELNGISGIGTNQGNNRVMPKNDRTEPSSFSSYMEETKDLDKIFEQAAQKYSVPVELLKAIGKAESDFTADAVSRSGAQGIMQLMPGTAQDLGVTDSFDPEQNIMGGAKYISQLLKKYDGDTSLALAAYNAGMGNVKKYGGIPPFEETQNYVVKVTRFMQQNLEAGTATVSLQTGSAAGGNTSRVAAGTPVAAPVVNWYLRPSVQTQSAQVQGITSGEVSDLLNALFSYQDYLKFLDLFLQYEKVDGRGGYLG